MEINDKIINLSHGGGGKASFELLNNTIFEKINNPVLSNLGDAAYISGNLAFTTDSFVVYPEFFCGGDIGKLAICGTCNDLAVSGAAPVWLSLSLVIPEGYEISKIKRIMNSIRDSVSEIGVNIVCGDTKVIESGSLKGLIVNTSGIGNIKKKLNLYDNIEVGDKVIFTSDVARHGISIVMARNDLKFEGTIKSDCCHLYNILKDLDYNDIHFSRDATRGGVAAVLNEIVYMAKKGIIIYEEDIKIEDKVKYLCEMLGFDPLTVANEGLAVLIVKDEKAAKIIEHLRKNENAVNACIAGEVIEEVIVALKTIYGPLRNVEMPSGVLLPRIC
jgi:hydrogenase expression/formation protein HypE